MTKNLLARGLKKLDLLHSVNFTVRTVINGRKYKIPLINGLGWSNLFSQELWMLDVLKSLYAEGGLQKSAFIDVGINVGQTLLRVKSIDNNIEYYGFEPNPACVYYLQKLISTNYINQVNVIPAAIARQTGITKLISINGNDTDASASIIESFRKRNANTKDTFTSVFDFEVVNRLTQIQKVSIIKIDVEGAELDVLCSLLNLIRKERPYIIMEILPVYGEENEERYERQLELEALIQELSYQIFRVVKAKKNLKKIGSIGIHSDLDACDYLLAPKESKNLMFK